MSLNLHLSQQIEFSLSPVALTQMLPGKNITIKGNISYLFLTDSVWEMKPQARANEKRPMRPKDQ